jgi:hypothetical protein
VFVAELNAFMASSFEGQIHSNLQLFHLPTKENPQCLESREEQPVETGGKKL